jgi:ferritin
VTVAATASSAFGVQLISDAMQQSLLQQLNDEFSSAYLYLAMSAYCNHIEFNGAANWLQHQYQEEQLHATRT